MTSDDMQVKFSLCKRHKSLQAVAVIGDLTWQELGACNRDHGPGFKVLTETKAMTPDRPV